MEGTTLVDGTLQPQLSLHHLDQLFHNGQAEPGAAVLPSRRAIGLRKGLENQALLVERDTNPRIPDSKVQEAARCPFLELSLSATFWGSRHLDLNHHLSARGEFDRIAHEVHQDLTQTPRIALQ